MRIIPTLFLTVIATFSLGCNPPKKNGTVNAPSVPEVHFKNVVESTDLKNYVWAPREKRPLTILGTIGNGAAFIDIDNDKNLDIVLVGQRVTLFHGNGLGAFTEDKDTFRNLKGYFLGCAVGDYDNDGFQDIYLTGYRDGRLLRNVNGKTFTDVTKLAGLTPQQWGTSASFADFNKDGKLDLFIANYAKFSATTKPQLCSFNGILSSCGPRFYDPERASLFVNVGDGRFKDVSSVAGADKVSGRGLGVAVLDFNFSGQDSIAVANDELPGDLLINKGMKFTNDGPNSGTAYDGEGRAHGGMGLDWGDYDNDGKPDLVVATFSHEVKSLYHNEGAGFFIDKSTLTGLSDSVQPFITFGIKFLDANNDGLLDLLLANGHVQDNIADVDQSSSYRQPIFYLENVDGSHFVDKNMTSGVAAIAPIVGRGLAVGDYDNDGRMDALVVDSEGKPTLLHNEAMKGGHYVRIKLIGTKSNRAAHGAILRLTLPNGKILLRHCQTDGSYLSASDVRIHFGLGDQASIKSLTVTWPSGLQSVHQNPPMDCDLTFKEGSSTVR